MPPTPIECANCGAQYRLPETFKSDKAKCKKCGAMIDVAGQRNAPAAAAPAQPAKRVRKPAAATAAGSETRSSRRSASSDEAATTRSSRRSSARSSRRGGGDGDEDSGTRRGGRSSKRSSGVSKGPVIAAAVIGLLAIVAVVVVFMMGGDEPTETNAAKAKADETKAAEAQVATEETTEPVEAAASTETAEAAVGDNAAPTEQPAAEDKAEELFVPSKELEPIAWHESTTEEEKARVAEYLTSIRNGGLGSRGAKTELLAMGAPALVGIVNELRTLDYTNWEDAMFGYELNNMMKALAADVVNAGYRPVQAGAEISEKDANWNGKTVKAWQRFVLQYRDPAAFERLNESRRGDIDR